MFVCNLIAGVKEALGEFGVFRLLRVFRLLGNNRRNGLYRATIFFEGVKLSKTLIMRAVWIWFDLYLKSLLLREWKIVRTFAARKQGKL